MSYIIYDDERIIDSAPRFQEQAGHVVEIPLAQVMALQPAGAKAYAIDTQLSLVEAKQLYRVVNGQLLPRPIVNVVIEPNVITGDGVDSAGIHVHIVNCMAQEKKSAIAFSVGEQEHKTIVIALNENMEGSASLKMTEKGVHMLRLDQDWPQATYLPQAILVV